MLKSLGAVLMSGLLLMFLSGCGQSEQPPKAPPPSKMEQPKAEPAKPAPPKAEQPKPDHPKGEQPKPDHPKSEHPK